MSRFRERDVREYVLVLPTSMRALRTFVDTIEANHVDVPNGRTKVHCDVSGDGVSELVVSVPVDWAAEDREHGQQARS